MKDMFILKCWSIINMSDWVEESIAVSESRNALISYHKTIVGAYKHIFDRTNGDYDEMPDSYLEGYYTIERIEMVD